MRKQTLYPLTFIPVLKDYIWGGRNLEKWGRELPFEGVIAESWEIAGHQDGITVVANGSLAGKPITDLLAELGTDLIGSNSAWALDNHKFPLLVKLLDANRPLSVQVHPDDAYAQTYEGGEMGKTEMWVVLHAEPGAELILGVKNGTTPEIFRRAIQTGQVENYLHRLSVQAGDHICVPAGTLHAIMDGVLIAEIQRNSNITYRVFDWNRLGVDGKPRPLHVDKAMDVINFNQVEPGLRPPKLIATKQGIRRLELCRNKHFTIERIEMQPGSTYEGECTGETMEIWGLIAGRATINAIEFQAIQFVLLPAVLGKFTIQAASETTFLRTYVEKPNSH
ncbi:MAG: class I mannose-6-phosphate isomerase [Chloroflexi bacterium]|jgi:mannose-6-phosphate isomerase|nr:class I mannose-6-phosphate isomerase [Chloroflexota bacterium]